MTAVDRLLTEHLRRARRLYHELVEAACRGRPEHAGGLRVRFEALRSAGMVGIGDPPLRRRSPAPAESAPARDRTSSPAPPSVDRYRLLGEIGRGGQGVVYLAEDRRIGRRVALKVLSGAGLVSDAGLRRFRREAEIASRLDHPGICTVYDTGTIEGKPYIAMRHLEGESLAARIERERRRARMRPATTTRSTSQARNRVMQTVALAEEVARTLHAAHEAGITHRDVKPRNIMVTPDERPVILDFGLAGDEDSAWISLTTTGDTPGTPAYMSPEQLSGGRSRIDARTDVWSLGATLYECLTLERPFSGETPEAVHRAIESTRPRQARRLNRAIPADLRVVIETALAKNPDRRYQSARALAEDLKRVRLHEPIVAKRASGVVRLARYVRRKPARAASIAALILGVILLLGLGGYVMATRPELARERARAQEAEVERRLGAGLRALVEGTVNDAASAFDRCLALAPDSAEVVAAKAVALERLGDRAALLAHFRRHAATVARSRALSGWLERLRGVAPSREPGEPDASSPDEDGEDRTRTARLAATDRFIAGLRALPADPASSDSAQWLSAVRHLRAAALLSDRTRLAYLEPLARATGRAGDADQAAAIADALVARWPNASEAWLAAAAALDAVDAPRAAALRARAAALAVDASRAAESGL